MLDWLTTYHDGLSSFFTILNTVIVATLTYMVTRYLDKNKRDFEYRKYKLEQVQRSLDEILRPRKELLWNVLNSDRKKVIDFFDEYLGEIDYHFDRSSHYLVHAKSEWKQEALRLKKEWPLKQSNAIIENDNNEMLKAFVSTAHLYKKCVASILIYEAKCLVEDG